MLIRRQDLSGLLLYYCGYSRIRNLMLLSQNKRVARFVAFHDVMPGSTKTFEANLVFLKHKTNVISLDDFAAGRLSTDRINTVITFDDGYKGWVIDALPILRKLELPATFFISSGFVGLSKDDEETYVRTKLFRTISPRKITGGLKEADIRLLVDNGHTIGSHTVNHIDLGTPSDVDQLRDEIAEDKLKLERMTGTSIGYFSYPTGVYRNPHIDLTELLRDLGYKAAVTTMAGFNTADTAPFLLRRDLTGAAMPQNVFKAHVYGNYDVVFYLKQRINAFAMLHCN